MVGADAASERKKLAFKLTIEKVSSKCTKGNFAGALVQTANFKIQRAKLVLEQQTRKVEEN